MAKIPDSLADELFNLRTQVQAAEREYARRKANLAQAKNELDEAQKTLNSLIDGAAKESKSLLPLGEPAPAYRGHGVTCTADEVISVEVAVNEAEASLNLSHDPDVQTMESVCNDD